MSNRIELQKLIGFRGKFAATFEYFASTFTVCFPFDATPIGKREE